MAHHTTLSFRSVGWFSLKTSPDRPRSVAKSKLRFQLVLKLREAVSNRTPLTSTLGDWEYRIISGQPFQSKRMDVGVGGVWYKNLSSGPVWKGVCSLNLVTVCANPNSNNWVCFSYYYSAVSQVCLSFSVWTDEHSEFMVPTITASCPDHQITTTMFDCLTLYERPCWFYTRCNGKLECNRIFPQKDH